MRPEATSVSGLKLLVCEDNNIYIHKHTHKPTHTRVHTYNMYIHPGYIYKGAGALSDVLCMYLYAYTNRHTNTHI